VSFKDVVWSMDGNSEIGRRERSAKPCQAASAVYYSRFRLSHTTALETQPTLHLSSHYVSLVEQLVQQAVKWHEATREPVEEYSISILEYFQHFQHFLHELDNCSILTYYNAHDFVCSQILHILPGSDWLIMYDVIGLATLSNIWLAC
jgi:hypothetical protein